MASRVVAIRPRLPTIAVVALVCAVTVSCSSSNDADGSPSAADATASDLVPEVGTLPEAAIEIMTSEPYANATWSTHVAELDSDEVALSVHPAQLMIMGSNMKLFTIGTALDVLGAEDRITTPVHQVGDDIVLVASGDPVMGGREASQDAPLGYSLPPQFDANGLPGAQPAPGNPVAGLEDLAAQVVAAGVTAVPGDVLVDTRLFEDWTPTESTISPIVVNDNLLGVITTPADPGAAPTLVAVPDTEAFRLVNEVETVAVGEGTDIVISEGGDANELVVSGTIEADSEPALSVYHVPDPASFARVLFIEALQREGVTVAADPALANDSSSLPAEDAYSDGNRLGTIESPTLQVVSELVLKISHNEVANLMICLMAVDSGSSDCTDGFEPIRERTASLGITPTQTWFVDGAGGGAASTTAGAMTEWLSWINGQPFGEGFPQMLPILGEDGSIGMLGTESPAKGKIQAKTGTTAALDASNGHLLMQGKALAGYMQADDGTPYYFALYMTGANFPSLQDQFTVHEDLGDVAIAIQQNL